MRAPITVFLPCSLHPHRHSHKELQRTQYVTDRDIQWHGEQPHNPDWSDTSRLVAFTLSGVVEGGRGQSGGRDRANRRLQSRETPPRAPPTWCRLEFHLEGQHRERGGSATGALGCDAGCAGALGGEFSILLAGLSPLGTCSPLARNHHMVLAAACTSLSTPRTWPELLAGVPHLLPHAQSLSPHCVPVLRFP